MVLGTVKGFRIFFQYISETMVQTAGQQQGIMKRQISVTNTFCAYVEENCYDRMDNSRAVAELGVSGLILIFNFLEKRTLPCCVRKGMELQIMSMPYFQRLSSRIRKQNAFTAVYGAV